MASLQTNIKSERNNDADTKLYSSLPELWAETLSSWMASTDPWLHFGYSQVECEIKLTRLDNEFIVALCKDQPIGVLVYSKRGDLGGPHIHYVVVEESNRSKGVGQKLIQQLLKESGDKSVYLTVSESNPRAKKLYESVGFRQIGAIPDYNYVGESEFIMRFPGRPKREEKSQGTRSKYD